MTEDGSPSLSALVPCGVDHAPLIAETLLSLAAQTCTDFDVHLVVTAGSLSDLSVFTDLVGTFEGSFAGRVRVADTGGATPFGAGVTRSGAAYVAVLYPDDVVFAHWAETFVDNLERAGGRAMSTLVATQAAAHAHRDGGGVVTTVARPRIPEPRDFDLLEHLSSPPVTLRGLALPRQRMERLLPLGLPPEAEAWAVLLVAALSCGILETREVTCLSRTWRDGRPPFEREEWDDERADALEMLDRSGLVLAPGALLALAGRLEELAPLRGQLQDADEAVRALAAAEAAALQRVADLLSSASWKASAPLRTFGERVRRLRRGGP